MKKETEKTVSASFAAMGLSSGMATLGAGVVLAAAACVAAVGTVMLLRRRSEVRADWRLRAVTEQSAEMLLTLDGTDRITWANAAFTALVGQGRDLTGSRVGDILPAALLAGLRIEAARQGRTIQQKLKDGGGQPLWVACRLVPLAAPEDGAGETLIAMHDITGFEEREARLTRARQALKRSTLRDAQTGLPNRNALLGRLRAELGRARRRRCRLGVVILDPRKLGDYDSRFGMSAGEQALREIGTRLHHAVGQTGYVARQQGDRFTVLLAGGEDTIHRQCAKLVGAMRSPLDRAPGRPVFAVSAGFALAPADGPEDEAAGEQLLRDAALALLAQKRSGRAGLTLFTPMLRTAEAQRRQLEPELATALGRGQILPYFQPQIDMATGRLAGLEMLLRWQHPKRGLLCPDDFLDAAERLGLLGDCEAMMRERGLASLAEWRQAGLEVPSLSINASPQALADDNYLDEILFSLDRFGLQPSDLTIEVIESLVVDDTDAACTSIARLRRAGLRIELDDFGSGRAALVSLLHLDIDAIKLDRSLVARNESARGEAVIVALTTLARNFGIEVTAEGVERWEDLVRLTRLGCRFAQGFAVAPPMPAEQVPDYLSSQQLHMPAARQAAQSNR